MTVGLSRSASSSGADPALTGAHGYRRERKSKRLEILSRQSSIVMRAMESSLQ
jgi:hypothetical protein